MVARIAPSPITNSVAIGDAMAHAPELAARRNEQQRTHSSGAFSESSHEQQAAEAPPPPTPPGEAFAAAVISGQLAPRPLTTEELRQRIGVAWQPPASPLRLMDKIA